MKDFLTRKDNVAVSAYITDYNPSQITTNGALTIIDNSDSSIERLPSNSYSLFLDNLFLASGYGFSSYEEYNKGSYIANEYEGMYSYIINELNNLHNDSITINYTNSDTQINKEYSTYGWLKSYMILHVDRKTNTSYDMYFETVENSYVNHISLDCGNDSNAYVYKPIQNNTNVAPVSLILYKSNQNNESIIAYAPEIIFNDEIVFNNEINLNDNEHIEDAGSYFKITRDIEYHTNDPLNTDLKLICKRNNEVVYDYVFKDAIRWRYKILPFNTNNVKLVNSIDDITCLDILNNYKFSDNNFRGLGDAINYINSFITANIDKLIYLDNNDIEFSGEGYIFNDLQCSSFDYFIIEGADHKLDFYLNGIKNNNWSHYTFTPENSNESNSNESYTIYQSPQKYIGKHTWKICYRYE